MPLLSEVCPSPMRTAERDDVDTSLAHEEGIDSEPRSCRAQEGGANALVPAAMPATATSASFDWEKVMMKTEATYLPYNVPNQVYRRVSRRGFLNFG